MSTTTIVCFIIGLLVLVGVVGHIQTTIRLRQWLADIKEYEYGNGEQLPTGWIGRVLKEYQNYHLGGVQELNSQVLIEKHFFQQPIRMLGMIKVPIGNVTKLLHQLPATTIIVGVMGTFIGLTLAIMSMQETLVGIGNQPTESNLTVTTIVSSISAPFEGMSIAFITSIAGTGGALFLTLIQTGFLSGGSSIQYLQGKVMSDCEALLDHKVHLKLQNEKPQDSMEKLLDRLVTKVQESFQKSIGDFSSNMLDFTEGLKQAMVDVNGILSSQRDHTERFASSSEVLTTFGDRLSETVQKLETVQHSVDNGLVKLSEQLIHFERHIKGATEKQEAGQKRFEQIMQRSDKLFEESNKKTEEVGRALITGVETVLGRYETKHEDFERRMQQQNDDWFYRYQEKQEHYGRAADTFSTSVQQLEKSWYGTVEKLKRELIDQLTYVFERDRQSRMDQHRDHDQNRDLIRTFESLYQNLNREFKQTHQYMGDIYQTLNRLYDVSASQPHVRRFDRDDYQDRRRIPIQDHSDR